MQRYTYQVSRPPCAFLFLLPCRKQQSWWLFLDESFFPPSPFGTHWALSLPNPLPMAMSETGSKEKSIWVYEISTYLIVEDGDWLDLESFNKISWEADSGEPQRTDREYVLIRLYFGKNAEGSGWNIMIAKHRVHPGYQWVKVKQEESPHAERVWNLEVLEIKVLPCVCHGSRRPPSRD